MFVREYVRQHPCFYFQGLREELKGEFVNRISCSDSTICRALRFDLGLSRKVLTKRARESVPTERQEYVNRLLPFNSCPINWYSLMKLPRMGGIFIFVLIDCGITSNVYLVLLFARSSLRKHAWSRRGTPAFVPIPFSRGKRVSVPAAFDVSGFFAWGTTEDTFSRLTFHETFKSNILPYLNPWPLPRSIVILDNTKIHMRQELKDLIRVAMYSVHAKMKMSEKICMDIVDTKATNLVYQSTNFKEYRVLRFIGYKIIHCLAVLPCDQHPPYLLPVLEFQNTLDRETEDEYFMMEDRGSRAGLQR
ncbi:unnamed protein product [Phytophthora fragariaefolia]|uniref:Unnamed protein product n=1 Tax=Phytophthora fragariaefolia TaxID=1490495 RepID=A0A9W6XEY3_9STRA|nr:unnamed protein product [Phytophthora fragariaefolia]